MGEVRSVGWELRELRELHRRTTQRAMAMRRRGEGRGDEVRAAPIPKPTAQPAN